MAAITLRRGDTLAIPISNLGPLTGRTKLYFTMKAASTDADSAAAIQIEETAGLLYLNGGAGTAGQGSITVQDANVGNIVVNLAAVASAQLPVFANYIFDVQVHVSSTIRTCKVDTAEVVYDVTKATS